MLFPRRDAFPESTLLSIAVIAESPLPPSSFFCAHTIACGFDTRSERLVLRILLFSQLWRLIVDVPVAVHHLDRRLVFATGWFLLLLFFRRRRIIGHSEL